MTDNIEQRVLSPEKVILRTELQRLANVRGSKIYDLRCKTKLPYDSSTIVSVEDNLFYCGVCESNFESVKPPKNDNLYFRLFIKKSS